MTKIEIDLNLFAQKPYREAFSMLFPIKLCFQCYQTWFIRNLFKVKTYFA